MGENGETPHWRVDKAAAARGPGTVTTADTTDGTSLVTPVSSLQDRMVQLVKPPPSPPHHKYCEIVRLPYIIIFSIITCYGPV
jgi:hypothetical protein